MRVLALVVVVVVGVVGCGTDPLSPIRVHQPEQQPRPEPGSQPEPDEAPVPEPTPAPHECGERIFDQGPAFDMTMHQGRLVVGGEAGGFVQVDDGGFDTFIDDMMWRVRSYGDALYAVTATDYLWDAEAVSRFDDHFAQTTLFSPDDLHELAVALHPTPPSDGSTLWTVPSDIAILDDGDMLITVNDVALVDHLYTGEVPDQAGHLLRLHDDGAFDTIASDYQQGAIDVDGDDVYTAGFNLSRFNLELGTSRTLAEAAGPQSMFDDGTTIFFTVGSGGGVFAVDKASGDAVTVDQSPDHWDAGVVVADGYVWWMEEDFASFGPARLMRVPRDDLAAAHETVTDCLDEPNMMLIHDGVIDVAGYTGVWRVEERL